MDEMKIKLSTKFMKNVVSKLLSKFIYMKTGYKVTIQIEEFDFWSYNSETTVKMNVEAKMKSEEFNKILNSINED